MSPSRLRDEREEFYSLAYNGLWICLQVVTNSQLHGKSWEMRMVDEEMRRWDETDNKKYVISTISFTISPFSCRDWIGGDGDQKLGGVLCKMWWPPHLFPWFGWWWLMMVVDGGWEIVVDGRWDEMVDEMEIIFMITYIFHISSLDWSTRVKIDDKGRLQTNQTILRWDLIIHSSH